ncbi:hypothetical protein LQ567_06085 [Niabella pedocola]|uniref:Glycosyl hydrolase family 32 N-terminal domain-containing protein n=1 Tax=Niabella pedocola TaxID=1752077 RepID=A0ABS8PMJ3_9BACT|nr:hypothetical protein [Niabella pedocola]MCD2422324.1 hypothetical protein [Niabella pedocola]
MPKCFFWLLISGISITLACNKEDEVLYAEDVPLAMVNHHYTELPDYTTDIGEINISAMANGNYNGMAVPSFIRSISKPNDGYCHPDVQYFPEGYKGYKYWMVFTPYFGSVGTAQHSKRFENPTVVVSNDGMNWTEPAGIKNPLALTPSIQESFLENKKEHKQGFWSDVDWLFTDNTFYLYYRGSFITAQALKKRGAKSQNNNEKLKQSAQRTIVRQTSTDGVHWTPLEVVYSSNPPYTPKNDHLLSPSFIKAGNTFCSYEVELNRGGKVFSGAEPSYVIQRTSTDGLNFSLFKKSKIVNFINTPWKDINPRYAPWHLQATYIDGFYFLCLATGDVGKYTADALFLAYSKDGVNFAVLPRAMVTQNVYRSAVFPMMSDDKTIDFGAVIGYKTGQFKYREFSLKKSELNSTLNIK